MLKTTLGIVEINRKVNSCSKSKLVLFIYQIFLLYLIHLYLQGADLVIALTHMRIPNDKKLLESDADIDLILGGHDHHYETKQV